MTRDDIVARYRRLRAISKRQQTAAMDRVAPDTMLDFGRRLGIVQGRTFICDSPSEMDLLFDLCVYAGKPGRSRAIDRYARSVEGTLHGDEAMMLRAAQSASFRVWHVEQRHELAGLWVIDLITGDRLWLIDEGLTATSPIGEAYAGRLKTVDDFVMTCGAMVPLSMTVMAAAIGNLLNVPAHRRMGVLDDPRIAIQFYRAAINTGTMETMEFRDPGTRQLEGELVD